MSWLLSGSRRTIAPPPPQPRGGRMALAGERTAGLEAGAGLSMRAPLPTTDALFAQEVEQKMSNLLAGFGAVQSFLDRTKHRTATQLAAAETSPGTSKIESNLPGWEDSNFDVMQAHRWVRS